MAEEKKIYYKAITNDWKDPDKGSMKTRITKNENNRSVPHPFMKWAGGKRQLISQMKTYLPKRFNNYIEPFVGGGALFFYLYRKNLIRNNAYLIDNNAELINAYRVVRDELDDLIDKLKEHRNEKSYYYKIRALDREPDAYNQLSNVFKASRIMYMNRCCFNGLYRVNSKGQFNVPFGRYKNPNFCDEENLKAVSKALQNVEIINGSFQSCVKLAKKGDLVYFDPPYHPLSETSSFTSYTKDDFTLENQRELFEIFTELDNKGCRLMLSNSYSEFILRLYANYNIRTLTAKRAINSNADKRGAIKEVLILNYDG